MKKKTVQGGWVVLALITLIFSGCQKERIVGNGNIISEERIRADFSKIVSNGSFNVEVLQDTVYELIIEAENNLIPYITTDVIRDELVLGFVNNVSVKNNLPIHIYIKTPSIDAMTLSGSGNVFCSEIETDVFEMILSGSGNMNCGHVLAQDIKLTISGSGNMNCDMETEQLRVALLGSGNFVLVGSADEGEIHLEGSGNITAGYLVQESCKSSITGSGSMFIQVISYLEATISGSGNIFYSGNPEVHSTITGSGKLIKQ